MEVVRGSYVFIDYRTAQKIKEILDKLDIKTIPKDIRYELKAIKKELEDVRDIDYSPLPGKQIYLTTKQKRLWNEVIGVL